MTHCLLKRGKTHFHPLKSAFRVTGTGQCTVDLTMTELILTALFSRDIRCKKVNLGEAMKDKATTVCFGLGLVHAAEYFPT